MLFKNLNIIEPILRALKDAGYTTPTPIQAQAIPHVLEGKDLLACAQTGTGKTAAFAIPVLQLLQNKTTTTGIKALILTPTRELAVQVGESLGTYGKHLRLKHTVIFGGVSQHTQTTALRRGVDIVVATPGRLLDLINQGFVNLNKVENLVLDEADRMLDMGFINDIRKIITKLPSTRQTIFFSATMPAEIKTLVASILKDPVKVEVTPESSAAETINQMVYFVEKGDKKALLQHIINKEEIQNVLVFTKTKHGADKVVQDLNRSGINAEAIHGNKSQVARQRALNNFKRKTTRVLVATDIAARGIDVNDLSFVINYELPNTPETYIHRIGRTGRAGTKGTALSFCDAEERSSLKDINKLANINISIVKEHPYESNVEFTAVVKPKSKNRPFNRSNRSENFTRGNKFKKRWSN
ncbi:MAG TPA: DEAD/DEAH box helicase [Cytophagales bacterium]|nr:DEAD/DEAH box helicase [Cytophagales bacterium]